METLSILDDLSARKLLADTVEEPDPSGLVLEQAVIYRTKIAQLWMEEDIRRGILPEGIGAFADVHDYMDANEYMMDEFNVVERLRSILEWDLLFFDFYDQYQVMVGALNKWLSNGREGHAVNYL